MWVIHQYAVDTACNSNRYDVTVLVNGLPLVHVNSSGAAKTCGKLSARSTATSATPFMLEWSLRIRADLRHLQRCSHKYLPTSCVSHIRKTWEVMIAYAMTTHSTNSPAGGPTLPITRSDTADFAATFPGQAHDPRDPHPTVLQHLRSALVAVPTRSPRPRRSFSIKTSTTVNRQTGSVAAGGSSGARRALERPLPPSKPLSLPLAWKRRQVLVVDRKDLDHQTIRELAALCRGRLRQPITRLAQQIDGQSVPIIDTPFKLTTFVRVTTGAILPGVSSSSIDVTAASLACFT